MNSKSLSTSEQFTEKVAFRCGLIILIFFLIAPRGCFSYPGLSLDPSFILALNYSFEHGFIFGTDVIFTYGPLSFISTGLCTTPFEKSLTVLVYFLVSVGYTWLIYRYLIASIKSRQYFVILIIAAALLVFPFAFRDIGFSITVLYLALTVIYIYKPRTLLLYSAALLVTLAFFIKVNTGIFLIIHFTSLFVFTGVRQRLKDGYFLTIIPFAFTLLSIIILSKILNVDVYNYVRYSFEIIRGYNETNIIVPEKRDLLLLAASFSIVALFLIFHNLKNRKILSAQTFAGITSVLFIYIVYKQSYVRADESHVSLYYTYSFFIILLSLDPQEVKDFNMSKKVLLALIVLVNTVWFAPIINKYSARKSQLPFAQLFSSFDETSAQKMKWNKAFRYLPTSFRNRIGNGTIDVLPWEQSFILYNNLNYRPRPIFQSYSAYMPLLDSLNAAFYEGEKAPQFLLFSNHTTDTRNPFWEETRTKMTIAKWYTVVDTMSCDLKRYPSFYTAEEPARILLMQRKAFASEQFKEVGKTEISLVNNSILVIPKSQNLMVLKLNLNFSILGNLRSTLFQAVIPEAQLKIGKEWTKRYRVFPSTFKDGVIINKAILDTRAAELFLSGDYENLQDVDSIKFNFNDIARYVKIPANAVLYEYKTPEKLIKLQIDRK